MSGFNLKGKRAFIAGIGDDQGFGWAIAKALANAGVEILVGTWTPLMKIFTTSLERGKFDGSRQLDNGQLMSFEAIYPLDAMYDTEEDIPSEVRESKRYKGYDRYSVAGVASQVRERYGNVDIVVHALANAPEVNHTLLETSRSGYLASLSASSYSFVSLLRHFGPLMPAGGATLSLTFMASEKAVPGYGGGMSSAKAALESDTRTLAWEAGRKWGLRVNTISAGPWRSRAAKAIGFIDRMIDYSKENAPLAKELQPTDVGNTALFLLSPLANAITGTTLYVDNGLHAMGVAMDSPALSASPKQEETLHA